MQELRLLLASLQPELSEVDLQYLEAMMDANQDSKLTTQEFLDVAKMALESLQQGKAGRAQEVVATTGAVLRNNQVRKGRIKRGGCCVWHPQTCLNNSEVQVRRLMSNICFLCDAMQDVVEDMFNSLDADQDGLLCPRELALLLK